MSLSNAEARRQRRKLYAEIAEEHLRAERAKLAELRQTIRAVTGRRKAALALTRVQCRAGAVRAKERAKARVIAIREEARAAVKTARRAEVLKARAACKARKVKVRASALSARAQHWEELRAERDLQNELKRIEAWARGRHREVRATAAERRQESDDEVRQNIPPELVPLFDRVRRSIRGSTRHSRSEDFMLYAAEHPDEVVDAQVELSQREIAKLIHEEARLAKAVRRPRHRPTAAELAAIPF